LKRLVFACDEVAEILDKSGADKTRKDTLASIESKLSIIARQSRQHSFPDHPGQHSGKLMI